MSRNRERKRHLLDSVDRSGPVWKAIPTRWASNILESYNIHRKYRIEVLHQLQLRTPTLVN